MEAITTVLIGVGGLLMILSLLLGIVELATLRTIRPPKQKTFTYIRLAATQYQTIIAPAMGALISGLFVSLSASFFYASLASEQNSSQQLAGFFTFIAGAVALAITLRSVLKDVGEPVELVRDPFTIRAAADESAVNPRRGALHPDILTQQLDEWEEYISARSMNLFVKSRSDRLSRSLTQASRTRGFWSSIWQSFHVYCAAFLRFPVRFGWPFLGYALLVVGTAWFAVGFVRFDLAAWWRPWGAMALFVLVGAVPMLFYCVTRGNRARLWYRINVVALDDARGAIETASTAHAAVAAEDERLRRVLTNADAFFQHAAPDPDERTIFRLGRFRVSIDTNSRSIRRR